MERAEQIKQKLTQALAPQHLELINESHRHAGHAGHDGSGESHFQVVIVASAFEGLAALARHRLVYDALGSSFAEGLHALKIRALTPDEFTQK